jgi:integrase
MAGKQAKIISPQQATTILTYLTTTRHPRRNKTMFLLSVKAGLRAGEIAALRWSMVTDASGAVGDLIAIEDRIAKRGSGRIIPLNRDLRSALIALHAERSPLPDHHVVPSERAPSMTANSIAQWFGDLYRRLGFVGCSRHSGRRTFVTIAARKVALVGGSLRDVQQLAGHRSLQMTAAYVEGDAEAKRKLVNLI